MRFHCDKPEDAFYIRFDERPNAERDEVDDGVIFDFDKQGKIVGIKILEASRKLSPKFRGSLQYDSIAVSRR